MQPELERILAELRRRFPSLGVERAYVQPVQHALFSSRHWVRDRELDALYADAIGPGAGPYEFEFEYFEFEVEKRHPVGTAKTAAKPGELVEVELGPRPDDGTPSDGQGHWFCLKVPAFKCEDCGRSYSHINDPERHHAVVVWPDFDDPALLRLVQSQRDLGVKVEIKLYEKALGRCVSYYASSLGANH